MLLKIADIVHLSAGLMGLLARMQTLPYQCLLFLGFETGPFSENKVDQFMEEMNKRIQNVNDHTERTRVRNIIVV